MSNIYIQEPPSNGKVLLKTTVGDIDIELWSKEAPKACRNFVQLCMEGYYDGTSFHRVVKDFIVQGGDPTDSGEGGESIYGAPFKDEFHTRLRFVRRGLVAMANAGPHDNGSQFFFTMGATPELQNKHTIFGKVVGDTLYNMLKLQEVEVDEASERPGEPHKILSAEVLNNPFDDIVPRQLKRQKKDKDDEKKVKSKSKATKNFSLLSFGDEAEDDEEQVDKATESFRGKSKSSHDLTDDPRLSSVPAVDKDRAKTADEEKRKKNTEDSPDEGRVKREEKKTEGEEEEAADKTESPKEESVKKKSSSPKDSEKRKSDSPEETKKPKTESKPEGKRKSRFEPLESEKMKSPEPAKTNSPPEDSDTKRRKTEAEGDSKKSVKDEVKEDSRKKKQETEPSQDSKKRKGDESHKEERKKRNKDTEDEEKKKKKGDGKDEEGRKKRKGEEVKEEGKKKVKTEAVSSPRPTEDEKNTKDDVRQKLKKEKEKEESPRGKESKSLLAFVEEEKQNRMDEIKKEQRRLQRDIKDSKKRTTADDKAKVKAEDEEEVDEKKDGDTEENDLLALVKKERMKYKQRKKQMGKKEDREAATLAMLSRFQTKLSTARTLAGDYDDVEEEKTVDEETEDPDDISWLRHKLHFEDAAQKTKVIDANISDNDRYTLIDPRNPLNQRRRETSKRAMRDKR